MPGQIADFDDFLFRTALSERSKSEYAATIRRFASWADGRDDWPPTDPWQREHLTRDYVTYLRIERSARPSTTNAVLSALDLLWVHMNLGTTSVKREMIPQLAPRGLTKAEEKRLLREAECRGVRDHALILLLAHCGPRLDETYHLDVSDVTLTARTADLHVRHGKGDRQRHVTIPDQAKPVMAEWLRLRSTMKGADGPALWLSRRGTRLSPNAIDDVVRGAGAKCSPPIRVSAHVLRHTAAHRLRLSNMDPFMIAEILGHASVRTTQIYGRPTADEKAERMAVMRIDY